MCYLKLEKHLLLKRYFFGRYVEYCSEQVNQIMNSWNKWNEFL